MITEEEWMEKSDEEQLEQVNNLNTALKEARDKNKKAKTVEPEENLPVESMSKEDITKVVVDAMTEQSKIAVEQVKITKKRNEFIESVLEENPELARGLVEASAMGIAPEAFEDVDKMREVYERLGLSSALNETKDGVPETALQSGVEASEREALELKAKQSTSAYWTNLIDTDNEQFKIYLKDKEMMALYKRAMGVENSKFADVDRFKK